MRNSRLQWRRVFSLSDLSLCIGVLRQYETTFCLATVYTLRILPVGYLVLIILSRPHA